MSRVLYLLTAFASAVVVVVCVAVWSTSQDTLPAEIRIAAGKKDGLYHTFANEFAKRLSERTGRPVRVLETVGSEANVELLRQRGTELALTQTVSLTPEGVVGIAPLFPEPLHFIVRKSKDKRIGTPADLVGRRVALGLAGSSIRQNSRTILAHYGVALENVRDRGEYFGVMAADPSTTADLPDAALVTTGWMNPALEKILQRDDMELVGLADAEALATRHPWFVPMTIPRGLYSGKSPVPPEPVRTVAVTALLTARTDASDDLVREALIALYETDLRSSFPAVMSAKAAKDYDAALMHPRVAIYHDPSMRFKRISRVLELASKSKEVLFGLAAFAVLVWGWIRRRREQAAAAADQVQKQKLDGFIGQTLTVELEQMEIAEPEELRAFLRRVTQIKQEALKELTSEKVRGDQLFAIFLSQCAALSEKIQLRMMYARMSEPPTP